MKIVKKNGKYHLFLNQNTSVEIGGDPTFRIRDIVKVGTGYYQVVNIFDNTNSALPLGEAKYFLEITSADELIEMAYNVYKI